MSSEWGTTILCPITVHLADGSVFEGAVHLFDRAPGRLGAESILDFLNRDERFFALQDREGGVQFVGKDQVMHVIVSSADFPDATPPGGVPHANIDVEVMPPGEETLHGVIHVDTPPGRTRAIDFLNSSHGFLVLTTPHEVRLVNRRLIRLVRPKE
jgi:hypothetical protein